MYHELESNIAKAFAAPLPQKKQEFVKKMRPAKINTFAILRMQASYIRAVCWILPIMIIPVVLLGLWQNLEGAVLLTEALTPFLAAVGILETWRSCTYRMSELEQATRFSLRTVMYARMLLTGCVTTGMILLSSAVLAFHFGLSFLFTGARIMIPYLLTMSMGLQVERTAYGRNNSYCSVVIAAIIAVLALFSDMAPISLAVSLSKELVIALATGLFVLTIWQAIKTIRFTEAYA